MNLFNGRYETVRLERGQRFGIPPRIYHRLAQATINASELAGIEPVLLDLWKTANQGQSVSCLGPSSSFSIQIEMEAPPAVVAPGMVALDDWIHPLRLSKATQTRLTSGD